MEWDDLRVLLAIAREGSLRAAARRLSQTQPTMGRRLRALEQAVGHTLFQRTSEGFVLTYEGELMAEHAERMEVEALAIARRVGSQSSPLAGELRVTSSDWFGVNMLTPVLAEFVSRQPLVRVELLTDARFLSLTRREADVAFRIRPFDEPDVVSRRLLHMRYGVYAKAELAARVSETAEDIPLLALDSGFSGVPGDGWLQDRLPRARIVFRSNNRDVQARMCALGVGVSVLPVPLGDTLPGVTRIDLGGEPPGRDTWVGYHRDLRQLGRLRALLDLVIERLGG